jgi:AraC-like DNA-binding protein
MNSRLNRVADWEEIARVAEYNPSLMADLCLVSLRHLERFFKFEFRRTPTVWIRELRCRTATRLVAEGWSTKAIAAELKFADGSHFCHDFKRTYGASPQAFSTSYVPQINVALRQECRA